MIPSEITNFSFYCQYNTKDRNITGIIRQTLMASSRFSSFGDIEIPGVVILMFHTILYYNLPAKAFHPGSIVGTLKTLSHGVAWPRQVSVLKACGVWASQQLLRSGIRRSWPFLSLDGILRANRGSGGPGGRAAIATPEMRSP